MFYGHFTNKFICGDNINHILSYTRRAAPRSKHISILQAFMVILFMVKWILNAHISFMQQKVF